MIKKIVVFLVLFISSAVFSQKTLLGQIIDFDSTVPIAFAKISYNNQTIYSDWEGKFSIQIIPDKKPIFVFYKGYKDLSYFLSKDATSLVIKMVAEENQNSIEIYSEKKVNAIIKKVIENKPKTQPEKAFKTFQYKNYEQVVVSANPKDITDKIDTLRKKNIFGKTKITLDSSNYKFKRVIENQHLYQTEKINQIQFAKKKTKETILASRMAGFKQPLYEYLGLNLVSYSLYENQLEILETSIQNPLSNYGQKLFVFSIIDTLKIQNRSVYRIYFQPKKLNSNNLRGLLYIDAQTFGIAKAFYKIYGIAQINATFTFNYLKDKNIWFADKRVIKVIKGSNAEDITILGGTIRFNSQLEAGLNKNLSDQIFLQLESSTHDLEINKPVTINDPNIKINVPISSFSKPESFWKLYKKDTLDVRKIKTYSTLDSMSIAKNYERKLFLGKKIFNGYYPIGILDVDLRSIVKYNNYEGFRIGFGTVTNTNLSKNYKIGSYIAYGFKDKEIKFGISPSYLLDQATETWVSASYTDDLSEIGQISFATQNKRFKIYDPRPINISTFYSNKTFITFIESQKVAKTELYFSLSSSYIKPLFDYGYEVDGLIYQKYNVGSAQFSVQWNPFSEYMQTSTGRLEIEKKFPKFSFQITQTLPSFLGNDFDFSKIDFKIQHEIPFLSGQLSSFVFQAGLGYGDIPLTHLYSIAPNNLNKDAILKRITFSGKNSFETMYFNEFFSNRYFSLQARHTFAKVHLANKVNPSISGVTRMSFGAVDRPEQHKNFGFKTLEKGFFESGIEVNKLYKGLGLLLFYRYGLNRLPKFEDNLALKVSFNVAIF